MTVGNEVVMYTPPQRVFKRIASHDRAGARQIALLAAGEEFNFPVMQVLGNAEVEIFHAANVDGVWRAFFSAYPAALVDVANPPLNGFEAMAVNYVASPPPLPPAPLIWNQITIRIPVRAEYLLLRYTNDTLAEQLYWDFSVQYKPIGGN